MRPDEIRNTGKIICDVMGVGKDMFLASIPYQFGCLPRKSHRIEHRLCTGDLNIIDISMQHQQRRCDLINLINWAQPRIGLRIGPMRSGQVILFFEKAG